jgi:hypothetical protein
MDQTKDFFSHLPEPFYFSGDAAQSRLLLEYGAVFVARGGVVPPDRVVFEDEAAVSEFQSRLDISTHVVDEFTYELQSAAMDALLSAIGDAKVAGLKITGRGADSARRNYQDTIALWKSRVEPALIHWVGKGRISQDKADGIRALSPYEQLPEVFAMEEDGIYFAKDLTKSVIYSVAPPGASQHLSLLAFDVAEFENPQVRNILADNFWYQTVVSDLPHFTFLGVPKDELPPLGLRPVTHLDREFWIPDI